MNMKLVFGGRRGRAMAFGPQARVAIVIGMLAAALGCGSSGPPLLPVKGKVTIDGKPATEGGVVFHAVDNPMVQLVGNISQTGDYSIMSRKEFGAPAGQYRVTVVVTETPKRPDGQPVGLPKTISNMKYADATKSPFTVQVAADAAPNAYDLALTK
jgi:hypothetical protein